MAAFEVSYSTREEFFKKVNGEIAFALISLFHVQIQEPASRSTTTTTFVFLAKFIIAKYLKQEVDDNLSIWMDEISPSGLSVTEDIKIYQRHVIKRYGVTNPNGEVPYGLLSRSFFYCPNLISVAPVTRDKEICQSHVITR